MTLTILLLATLLLMLALLSVLGAQPQAAPLRTKRRR